MPLFIFIIPKVISSLVHEGNRHKITWKKGQSPSASKKNEIKKLMKFELLGLDVITLELS
jgi:hypothetical protein